MEINTETTQKIILEHLSQEEIQRMKDNLRNMNNNGLKELKVLCHNLKQSVLPISDGVLIRILTDVGYVSCYKSRGYLGITTAVELEAIVPKENPKEKAEREYEEYLIEEAEKQ